MFEKLSSHSNPKVKTLLKLGKGRGKERKELFVFEGLKEIQLAVEAGIRMHSLFFCPELYNEKEFNQILKYIDQDKVYEITPEIFARIAYRDSTGGLLMAAHTQYLTLHEIKLSKNPLVLVLESVEKPGNLGGIIRTADAANIDAVIICDPRTDLYNPNVIRSSVGCIFTTQVVACESEEAITWLRANKIKIYATDLNTEIYYHQQDFTKPCAIIMGTEHDGLSKKWLQVSDQRIKIPMAGKIDSLNVSTSTAILVFEAVRQRGLA
jgi:RNA methyltransferase, TrmH family